MKNYRIDVTLTDEEEKLVEWMAKEDFYGEKKVRDVLVRMLYLQLREDMDIYGEDMNG